MTTEKLSSEASVWLSLQDEANAAKENEPILTCLLQKTVLHPKANNLASAIAYTIASRLVASCGAAPSLCPNQLAKILMNAMESDELEYGHLMMEAVIKDALAYYRRDPACESLLEVILYFKGFASLVCHRAAKRNWGKIGKNGKASRFVSLWLQSQASAAFGVDIHPAAEIGAGVMFDHASGVVVGETAVIGDGCTLLHGVTLGGTGKEAGDRHPKVGNHVLIGAGSSILGNIIIGDGAKIGAGSVVLKPIPHGATAVGSPAKIIGWAKEKKPGSRCDVCLKNTIPAGFNMTNEIRQIDSTSNISSGSDGSDEREEESDLEHEEKLAVVTEDKKEAEHEKRFLRSSFDFKIVEPPQTRARALSESFCDVWRGLKGKEAPCDAVCVEYITNLLLKENATDDEIGEVYFDLLKKNPNLGYVPVDVFKHEFVNSVSKYTKICKDRCREMVTLMDKDLKQLEDSRTQLKT